jgi:hypothetical protein
LKHFILHTNSSINSLQKWELLFMNQHDSYCISEFICLANNYCIRSFSFVSHLIHYIQSLNVDIFHSYKKHYNNVIKQALTKFYLQYSLKQFSNNLNQIREHTFKEIIIRFAFEKFDMCLITNLLSNNQVWVNQNWSIKMFLTEIYELSYRNIVTKAENNLNVRDLFPNG